MKKLLYIAYFLLVIACDSENAGDCFQTSGGIVKKEFTVPPFNKILVNRDVELIIKEGAAHNVLIETGKNLLNEVDAVVIDQKLILTNNNTCNYVRDFGITKIFVTAPNIIEIRSSTQYDISSDGVLTYPSLTILSEDFGAPGSNTSANFRLQIDNTSFSLIFNNLSNCFISGKTNNVNINFASGDGRFEGAGLVAQNVFVNHRGTNDMILNPQQSIRGVIRSNGDVISINKPAIVDVDILFKGQLIFE